VLALVAVGIFSWADTRQHLRIFMNPSPVPRGLHVHHGRSIMFSSYVHFTGSPAVIASLLQSKGLAEIPPEPAEGNDWTSYSARQQTNSSWDWWQPGAMSNARFFFLHHKSLGIK
jgi:cytochrome c1